MSAARGCHGPGCARTLTGRQRLYCSDRCRRVARRTGRKREAPEFEQAAVRIIAALARRCVTTPDAEVLGVLLTIAAAAELAAAEAIDLLREHGFSWADLAAGTGISRQGLSQWRKRRPDQPTVNEPFTRAGG